MTSPAAYLIGVGTLATGTTCVITAGSGGGQQNNAGDAIIVGASASGTQTVSSVTDSAGNIYTEWNSSAAQNPTSGWIADASGNPGGPAPLGATGTITVVFNASTGTKIAGAVGCPGVADSPIDQNPTTTSNAGSTSPSITSGALTQPVEICVAIMTNGNAGGESMVWAAGWTSWFDLFAGAGGQVMSMATMTTASSSAVTASGTISSAKWCMLLVTLRLYANAVFNSFETGTAGSTVSTANSGGGSGFWNNAFDTVAIGTAAAYTYQGTVVAHGSLAAQVTTGTAAVTSVAEWGVSVGSLAQAWFRFYAYFPSPLTTPVRVFTAQGSSGNAASVLLSTTGAIQVCDSTNLAKATFASTLPTGQWFRMEGEITGSATAGSLTARLYTVMDSAYPTETQTASSVNTLGLVGPFWFGQGTAVASTAAFYLDDVAVSASGYMGPASPLSVTQLASAGYSAQEGFVAPPPPPTYSLQVDPESNNPGDWLIAVVSIRQPAAGWQVTTVGTPQTANYFLVGTAAAVGIYPGSRFTDSGNPGQTFVIQSVSAPTTGTITVYYAPASTSLMTAGNVLTQGGVTVSVADDAHNWWYPLGTVQGFSNAATSSAAGLMRTTVWAAPAARAVNYLTVAPSGVYAALNVTLLDVSGLSPYAALEANISTYAASGTTLTLATSTPPAQALVFSSVNIGYVPNSPVLTGSGWSATVAATTVNGVDHNGDSYSVLAWQYTTLTTSATWTSTIAAAMSAESLVLSVTGTAPAQSNPYWPWTTTEIAADRGPGDTIDMLTWQPLSQASGSPRSRVLSMQMTQGKQYMLDQLQAGQGSMTLDDPDQTLIPPGSGQFSGLDSGTPFRVRQAWAGGPWQVQFASVNGENPLAYSLSGQAVTPNQVYTATAYLGSNTSAGAALSHVGAFLDTGPMQVANFTAALAQWTGLGLPRPSVCRYYLAQSTFTYDTNMQEMVAAGIKICLDVRPAYNPVSSTDLANLTTLLQTLRAAGANCDICIWHEPYYSGLTVTQYQNAVEYYGPTVRQYYPLVFVTSVQSVQNNSENSYYPGDAYVDKCATDYFCWDYAGDGYTLTTAATPANNANPPKPFGIWELGSSTDPIVGQSTGSTAAFLNYVAVFFAERLLDGYENADLLWYNSGEYDLLGVEGTANTGFEGGVGNWTATFATLTDSTLEANTGSYSAHVQASSSSNASITQPAGTLGVAVTSGAVFTVAGWFRTAATARSVQAGVNWYGTTGSFISSSFPSHSTDSSSSWVHEAETVTAPANGYAQAVMQIETPAANEVHYVDDAVLALQNTDASVIGFGLGSSQSSDSRISLISSLATTLNATSAAPAQAQFFIGWAEAGSWSYSVSGTPTTTGYFTVSTAQAAAISTAAQFTDTLNPGQIFTVTSIGPPSGGAQNVFFTPAATRVMGSPDVVSLLSLSTVASTVAYTYPGGTLLSATGTVPAGVTTAVIGFAGSQYPSPAVAFYAAAGPPVPNGLTVPPAALWYGQSETAVATISPWQYSRLGAANASPWMVPVSGYFQRWPPSWQPETLRGQIQATTADIWAYGNIILPSVLRQEILTDAPFAYWPLSDPEGSMSASNIAPGNASVMNVTQSKYGVGSATQMFGANSGGLFGDQITTITTSSRSSSSPGMWAQAGVNFVNEGYALTYVGYLPPVATGITVVGWWQITSTTSGDALLFNMSSGAESVLSLQVTDAGALQLEYTPAGGTEHAVTISAGSFINTSYFVNVAVEVTTTAYTVYLLGGATTVTGTFVSPLPQTFTTLSVGGWTYPGQGGYYDGSSAHVAVFPYLVPEIRVTSWYFAAAYGLAVPNLGEYDNNRAERLLSYSGLINNRMITQGGQATNYSGSNWGDWTPVVSGQDLGGNPASTGVTNLAGSVIPGLMYVSPNGDIVYMQKSYTYNQPVKWVLGDDLPAGEIPITSDYAPDYDPARVVNDIQLTQLDDQSVSIPGNVALEFASRLAYGYQSYTQTGYLQSDPFDDGYNSADPDYNGAVVLINNAGEQDLANWIAQTFWRPHLRVAGVTVDSSAHPAAWVFVSSVAVGDIVTVNTRMPTAGGQLVSITGRVTQTQRTLQFTTQAVKGAVTLVLDSAPEMFALQVGSSVYGLLNQVNVLAW